MTPSKPHPPMNNFCLYPPPVLRCFRKDPLMTPTTLLQASFTATPFPSTTRSPIPKNSDHTPSSSGFPYQIIRENHIAGQSQRKSTHVAIPTQEKKKAESRRKFHQNPSIFHRNLNRISTGIPLEFHWKPSGILPESQWNSTGNPPGFKSGFAW